MTEKKFLTIQTVWSLAAGAVLYAVLSPDVWFVRELGAMLHRELQPVFNLHSPVLRYIRWYGPDMMWGYALTSALLLFSRLGAGLSDRTCLIISCIFSAILEFLQLLPWISGTFDVLDIVTVWLAQALAFRAGGHAADRKEQQT